MRVMRLSLCLLFAVWLASPAAPEKKGGVVVYVTESGKKYHQADCPHVRGGKAAKSLEEAIEAGFTACARCDPPVPGKRPGPPAAESKRVLAQCQGVTRKGVRCKRKASAGGAYCWQHKK